MEGNKHLRVVKTWNRTIRSSRMIYRDELAQRWDPRTNEFSEQRNTVIDKKARLCKMSTVHELYDKVCEYYMWASSARKLITRNFLPLVISDLDPALRFHSIWYISSKWDCSVGFGAPIFSLSVSDIFVADWLSLSIMHFYWSLTYLIEALLSSFLAQLHIDVQTIDC